MMHADGSPPPPLRCPVCLGGEFDQRQILWPELVAEWQLSDEEARYVDVQQGYFCATCGCNLRSMTLAAALMRVFNYGGSFEAFCKESEVARRCSLLEINRAGSLTGWLQHFSRYRLVEHPDIDLQNLAGIPDASWDIVVHSDTLEHVPDPVRALSECRRVLLPGGVLAFTIPVIVGRLSRRRDGRSPSYHGGPSVSSEDVRVVSEYGADFWCQVMQAGFGSVEIHALRFPHSLAVVARKD